MSMPPLPLMSLCLCLLLLCDLSPLVPATGWSICAPPPVRLSLSATGVLELKTCSSRGCSRRSVRAHTAFWWRQLPDIYGLQDLTAQAKTAVRKETLLALRMDFLRP